MSNYKKVAKIIMDLVEVEVERQLKATIREEVKRQVNLVLNEQISPKEEPAHNDTLDDVFVEKQVSSRRRGPQFKTGNPVLDKILNETKGGIPQTEMGAYPNLMGNDVFDTSDMGTILTRNITTIPIPSAGHSGARLDTKSETGQVVAKNLTKDYSALMNKLNGKK